jgi:hypothetical protein
LGSFVCVLLPRSSFVLAHSLIGIKILPSRPSFCYFSFITGPSIFLCTPLLSIHACAVRYRLHKNTSSIRLPSSSFVDFAFLFVDCIVHIRNSLIITSFCFFYTVMLHSVDKLCVLVPGYAPMSTRISSVLITRNRSSIR